MDAAARRSHGREEVIKDGLAVAVTVAVAVLLPGSVAVAVPVPVAHPAALALGAVVLGGVSGFAIVRGVADAHEDARIALHVLRAGALVVDPRLHHAAQTGRMVGRLQRVGEVDAGGFAHAALPQLLRDAEMGDGVRTHQDLEAEEPMRQLLKAVVDHARPVPAAHDGLRVIENAQQISARARRRIQHVHVVVRERVRLVEPRQQQFRREPRLRLHDLDGRVVDAPVVPQAHIVGAQELLVEVDPRVALPVQARSVHRADRPLQQLDGGDEFPADGLDLQKAQRLGEQAVLGLQRFGRERRRQPLRPLEAGEQQRVGQRLRVGVRELVVAPFGEQQPRPFVGEAAQRAVRFADRRAHLVAQDARERREVTRQTLRRRGRRRAPIHETAEERLQRAQLVMVNESRPAPDVVADADAPGEFAVLVEAPFRAVRVDEIGVLPEPAPLLRVPAGERFGLRADAGRLQFDEADQLAVDRDADVRPAFDVVGAHLRPVLDAPPRDAANRFQQLADGGLELVFGLRRDGLPEVGGDGVGVDHDVAQEGAPVAGLDRGEPRLHRHRRSIPSGARGRDSIAARRFPLSRSGRQPARAAARLPSP